MRAGLFILTVKRKEKIYDIGDKALLGVDITKGAHTITLKYTPRGLYVGCVISALTLVIFILLCIISKKRIFVFNPPLYVETDENRNDDAKAPSFYVAPEDISDRLNDSDDEYIADTESLEEIEEDTEQSE